MMDLRYHLASLMSVFLALAVGIMVGISLGSSERQAVTIQSVQRDVAAIRAEDRRLQEVNAELQRRLAAHEAAVEALIPLAVHGRLAGNRVALLLAGDGAADLAAPITDALRLAGADLVLTARLPRDEGGRHETPDPPAARGPARPAPVKMPGASRDGRRNSSSTPGPEPSVPGAPSGLEAAAATLTRALVAGQPALLEGIRARVPDLEVTGELRGPIRRFLLLCPNDQPDYARRIATGSGVEAAVAREARDANALLVAAEPEESRSAAFVAGTRPRETASLLPALSGLGASTVDDIETPAGQIAAVLALAGARGEFGTGPGATRALPPIGRDEGSARAAAGSVPAPAGATRATSRERPPAPGP